MASMPVLTVKWDCPICHTPIPLHMEVERPDRRGEVTLLVDGESRRNLTRHIKIHIAEVQKAWRSMEAALGSLGYAMEVQIDERIDPENDVSEDDEPDDDEPTIGDVPHGGDYPW